MSALLGSFSVVFFLLMLPASWELGLLFLFSDPHEFVLRDPLFSAVVLLLVLRPLAGVV